MMNQTDENSVPAAEQPLPQAPATSDAQSAVTQAQIPSPEAFGTAAPPMIQQKGDSSGPMSEMPPQGAAPYQLSFPPPSPPPPGVSVFSWRTKHFPRRTNWMFFYVYVRFILGFVVGAGSIFSSLSTITAAESYGIDESYVALMKNLLVISSLSYLFSIFVFNRARKLEASGYKLLLVHIGVEALMITINTTVYMNDYFYATGWEIATTALFALVITALCWFLPNYLYFRKRKDLFYDEAIH